MNQPTKCIIVPVYNEVNTVKKVIESIVHYKDDQTFLIIVQDGSSDGSREILLSMKDSGYFSENGIELIDHEENQGYGKALMSGFSEALKFPKTEYILTIDCDEQHEPEDIIKFFSAQPSIILSGSRYLEDIIKGITAPKDRVQINGKITRKYEKKALLLFNEEWKITDTFCGMKRYHRSFIQDFHNAALKTRLSGSCLGYGFPLIVWNFYLQWLKWNNRSIMETFEEIAIPKIYVSDDRSFGENLDFPARRYRYYLKCMKTTFEKI